MQSRVYETIAPLVDIFPMYHPDAADINEALDHGVASCAVRAYASALLLEEVFPNKNLYNLQFGFSPEHGSTYEGENGSYLKMGHAVTRLWVPGSQPLIVESYSDSAVEITGQNETHYDYIWDESDRAYENYLDIAGLGEVEVDAREILRCLHQKISAINR